MSTEPVTNVVVAINGYGIPAGNPADDQQYTRYLGRVVEMIRSEIGNELDPDVWEGYKAYLLGGATNRTDTTEANAMFTWLERHAFDIAVACRLVGETESLADNIVALAEQVSDDESVKIWYFCESLHVRRVEYLLEHTLRYCRLTVIGINFDPAARTAEAARTERRLLALTKLGTWFPPAAWLIVAARRLKLWRLRRQHATPSPPRSR